MPVTKSVVKVHLEDLEIVQGELLAYVVDVYGGPVDCDCLGTVVLIAPGADVEAQFGDEATVVTRTFDLAEIRPAPHWSVLVPIETPCEPIIAIQDSGGFIVDLLVGTHDLWVHLIVSFSNLDHQPFDAFT